jgi:DNA-binding LacI/PurR family transcriptional regulator
MICPELRSEYYATFVERMKEKIEQEGGIFLLSADGFTPEKQREMVEYYASYLKVDGVFVIGMKEAPKQGYDVPVLSVLGTKVEFSDGVGVNIYPTICEAIAYLKELGHRRIAFLGETLTESKRKMFCTAMQENGLEITPELVIQSEFRFEQAGEDGAKQLLDLCGRVEMPTAFLCGYDRIAIGAIRYLNQKGYSVPEDFSVIGMDNIDTTEYMDCPLTSIGSNAEEVCSIAWELMKRKMDGACDETPQKVLVNARLERRKSTGPVRKNEE